MAESSVVAELEEVFRCPVCLEHVSQPKMLACQHTFCLGCIQGVYNEAVSVQTSTKDVKCPMCKTVTSLSGGSVSDLPADFRANQVSSILEKLHAEKESIPTTCYICSKGGYSVDATVLCIDCGKIFCAACHSHHEERFQNHLYSSVKTEDIKSLVCQEHGEFIQTFCLDCKKGICQSCSQFTHSGHEISDFVKSDTTSVTSTIKEVREQMVRTVSQIKTECKDVNNELDMIKTRIRERKEQLIRKLEQKEIELLAKVENTAAQYIQPWEYAIMMQSRLKFMLCLHEFNYKDMAKPVPELSDISLKKLSSSLTNSIIKDIKDIEETKDIENLKSDMLLLPQFEFSDASGDNLDLGSFKVLPPTSSGSFKVLPRTGSEDPEAEVFEFEQNPQHTRSNEEIPESRPQELEMEVTESGREAEHRPQRPRRKCKSTFRNRSGKGEKRNRDHSDNKRPGGKKGKRGRNFNDDGACVDQGPMSDEGSTRGKGRRRQENDDAHNHEGRKRNGRNRGCHSSMDWGSGSDSEDDQ